MSLSICYMSEKPRSDRFNSSACDFLSKNRFDFGKVFTAGVPYLSRDEEAEILEVCHAFL